MPGVAWEREGGMYYRKGRGKREGGREGRVYFKDEEYNYTSQC